MRRRGPARTLAAITALLALPAGAWGPLGHRVVAELAEAQLQPRTREAVAQLLALEPGATLGSISSWADDTRTPATMPWHYVNFPRGDCSYRPARDCADGLCAIAAIERQRSTLQRSSDARERLTALKYLVHFVGDLHQPLHGAFGDDRGGNTYLLSPGTGQTNLHAWWDSGMIERSGLDAGQLRTALQRDALAPLRTPTGTPADWAGEDCRIASTPGFYPPADFDARLYQERWWPLLQGRLRLAGHRLARLLDEALLSSP